MIKVLGVVRVKGFGPARGATVEVHNATGDVVDQVVVNDDGGFTYHLSSGVWTFRVWDAWGHRGDGEITVSDGDTTAPLDLVIS